MKNKVLLFIAISLTTIGFIGLSSILMSEATQNNLYGNVYFKSLYLNNKDIYNDTYLTSRNTFYIPSTKLTYENIINFELFNNAFNDQKVYLNCLSKNGIIEILNNDQEFIISSNSSIKESIMISYDSNIEDSIECKIDVFE